MLGHLQKDYAQKEYNKMLARAPEHVWSLDKARSGARRYGHVCIMQACLCQLTLHTSWIVWKSSRKSGVKFEVFEDPSFGNVSGEWMSFNVDVGGIFSVPAHYFHISIDITIHMKQMIPTVTGGLSWHAIVQGRHRIAMSYM